MKFVGLVMTFLILFGTLMLLEHYDENRHDYRKEHKKESKKQEDKPTSTHTMKVKEIKVIQKENASGTQKEFKLKSDKDKNKVYEGSTQLDIAPGDTINYTKPTDNSTQIKIKSSERLLK